jgi:zinc transport system substrate-binding protein
VKFKFQLFALILVLGSFLSACNTNEEGEAAEGGTTEGNEESVETLQVYTTLFPLEDFTRKIGGEHIEVTNLIPPGSDAHTFEPTTKTMTEVAESDAFIYNGTGIEGFAEAIIGAVENEDVKVVEAGKGIELIDFEGHGHEEDEHAHEEENHEEDEDAHAHEEDEHDHEHGDKDPHVWLDPALSIQLAENIKDALVELKPDAEEDFEANFAALKKDLEELDLEFKEMVDESSKNTFIVSHAAYGYWENRYDLEQVGVSGLSPTNEPSQKQLQEIIEFAEEHEVSHIIFESNVQSNVADVVKNQIGAESLVLNNLESITDEDISNDEDYFSLMRKNIQTLRTALK